MWPRSTFTAAATHAPVVHCSRREPPLCRITTKPPTNPGCSFEPPTLGRTWATAGLPVEDAENWARVPGHGACDSGPATGPDLVSRCAPPRSPQRLEEAKGGEADQWPVAVPG